jgi:hypothetical protein
MLWLIVESCAALIFRAVSAGRPSCGSRAAPRLAPPGLSAQTRANACSPAPGVCQMRALRCQA